MNLWIKTILSVNSNSRSSISVVLETRGSYCPAQSGPLLLLLARVWRRHSSKHIWVCIFAIPPALECLSGVSSLLWKHIQRNKAHCGTFWRFSVWKHNKFAPPIRFNEGNSVCQQANLSQLQFDFYWGCSFLLDAYLWSGTSCFVLSRMAPRNFLGGAKFRAKGNMHQKAGHRHTLL